MPETHFGPGELIYENQWLRFVRQEPDEEAGVILTKEIKKEFIPAKESWNREATYAKKIDRISYLGSDSGAQTPNSLLKSYRFPKGVSLHHIIEEGSISMDERLGISAQLVDTVLSIHSRGLFFCDLNAKLFYYDLITEKLSLLDLVMTIDSKMLPDNQRLLVGIEPEEYCLSPEQTLRTGTTPDYRSNLYSLGVILYAVLCSNYPLQGRDRVSTIYKHISQLPIEPGTLNPDISKNLSSLLLKLLSKDPDDRYQSSGGLQSDFNKCLKQYRDGSKEESFEIGEMDFPSVFKIPEHLFYRQAELEVLKKELDFVINDGKSIVRISGAPGIGKSSLLESFFQEIDKDKVFAAFGKYSEAISLPYQGLKELSSDLLEQIYMLEDSVLDNIKLGMDLQVGELSGVLTEFQKDFEGLFKKVTPPPDLSGMAIFNRFTYAYTQFLKALSDQRKTIVLCLGNFDDAGLASFKFVESLLKNSDLQSILILVSFDDPEFEKRKKFLKFSEAIESFEKMNTNSRGVSIQLENFSSEKLLDIIEHLKIHPAKKFTKILFDKTNGNPFFIRQFFEELMDKKLIRPDAVNQCWLVGIQGTESIALGDNVQQFLSDRINQLDEKELHVLKSASIIGHQFRLDILYAISEFEKAEIDQIVQILRDKGFINPVAYEAARLSELQFSHQSFVLTIRKLMSRNESEKLQIKLLESQFNTLGQQEIQLRIYELVSYILKLRPEVCKPFIGHLESAALKAKNEAAFENAYSYYVKLFEIHQKTAAREVDKLYQAAYQAALCSIYAMRYDDYEAILKGFEELNLDQLQQYKLFVLRATKSIQQGNFGETIQILTKGLNAMGLKFPSKLTKFQIIQIFFKILWRIRGLTKDKVLNLEFAQDRKTTIYNKLIQQAAPAVFFAAPSLIIKLTDLQIKDILKKGLLKSSPYNFVSIGFMLNGFSNKIQKANEMGEIGLALLEEKIPDKDLKVPCHFMYASFIQHTKYPLKYCVKLLEHYYNRGREVGNVNTAFYCLGMSRWYSFFSGTRLNVMMEQLNSSCSLATDADQTVISRYHLIMKSACLDLMYGEIKETSLENSDLPITFSIYKKELETKKDHISLSNLCMLKLVLDAYRGIYTYDIELYDQILNHIERNGFMVYNSFMSFFYVYFHFLKCADHKNPGLLKKLHKYSKKYAVRAKHAPFNYATKLLLLQAVEFDMKAKVQAANKKYFDSYELAISGSNLWEQSLVCEEYGEFLIRTGKEKMGLKILEEGMNCYRDWGAEKKSKQIELKIQNIKGGQPKSVNIATTTTSKGHQMSASDLVSILKMSKLIMSENQLDSLVQRLLDLVTEEAGAHRSLFIIVQGDNLKKYAAKESGQPTTIDNSALTENDLPLPLVRLALRRKSPLVIHDALSNKHYNSNSYILSHKTKSILVIPMIRNQESGSLIYMENNLLKGIFDERRIDFLSTLCSQVAIAFDNAILNELLEEKLEIRSRQIEKEKEKSDELLKNILPETIADELKAHGKTNARHYDEVTVMFADFKNFTIIAESLQADIIVEMVDKYFRAFDNIIDKYHLEKIKTIGDAYMCAGGIPEPRDGHIADVLYAAIDMINYIEKTNLELKKQGLTEMGIRIGIHTGPVIAGVVGHKKYAYDIWGNTVNIAARMESSGQTGKINVSGATYLKIRDQFNCEYRGKVQAKNVGEIDMYFVEPPL